MGPLVRLKDTISKVVGAGRSKAAGVQRSRERSQLVRELGNARYAKSKGVVTSDDEMERIIAEIDALEQPPEEAEADPE